MELYARVRRAVQAEGISEREAARQFGLARETVRKMLRYSIPPGYRRQQPAQGQQAPACREVPFLISHRPPADLRGRLPLRPKRTALRASQVSAPTAPANPSNQSSSHPEMVYFYCARVV